MHKRDSGVIVEQLRAWQETHHERLVTNNEPSGNQLVRPMSQPNGCDKLPVPGISVAIAKSLDSPDAGERLLAFDHWEAQGTQPQIDLLFVVLDDEDEVLRRKMTEIIERF